MAFKNRDLTFVIKVKNAAQQALRALRGDLNAVGKEGQAAASQTNKAGKSMDDLAKRAAMASKAVKAASASNVRASAEEAAAADKVAAAYKRKDAAAAGGPRYTGSKALAAAQLSQMNNMDPSVTVFNPAAIKGFEKEAQKLRETLYPATAAYDKVIAKQKMYNDMLKAGAISSAEHRGAMKLVEKELLALDNVATQTGHGMKVNALAIRESLVLVREAARGDTSRMAGSASILAQSFGLLRPAALGATAGIAALALVAGLLAVAFFKGADESAHLTNILAVMNNRAGLTATTFHDMASGIAHSTESTTGAVGKLLMTYNQTSQFGQDALRNVTEATIKFARLTGQSADDVAKEWSKMADSPTKFAVELSKSYALLTAKQVEYIRSLEETGQKQQAIAQLSDDLKNKLDSQKEQVGYLTEAWRGLKGAISDAWQAMLDFGKPQTQLQQLNAQLKQKMADQQNYLNSPFRSVAATAEGKTVEQYNLDHYEKDIRKLMTQIALVGGQEQRRADATAKSNQVQQDGITAMMDYNDTVKSLRTSSQQLQDALDKYHDDLAKMKAAGLKLPSASEQAAQEAAIRKRYTSGNTLISAQDAIYRYGLSIQGQGFRVSENSHFGGVTPGVHHGLGHGQDRAIDVNSVAGSDAAVAWAKAKDTALAMDAASKGFIALFNHTRYAPDGHGGFTTSSIRKGQDPHTSHLHIEAPGSMQANGLGSAAQGQMQLANNIKEQALYQAQIVTDLQNQVEEAKKLPSEAQAYAEVQKVVNQASQKGVDISTAQQALLYQQYKALIDQRDAASGVNEARMANLDLGKQNYIAQKAQTGLTEDEQRVEDAKNAAKLQYLSKFDTLEEGLKHLHDADFETQLKTLEALVRQANVIDHQKITTQQLVDLERARYEAQSQAGAYGKVGYDRERYNYVEQMKSQLAAQQHIDPWAVKPEQQQIWADIVSKAEQYGQIMDQNHEREVREAGDLGYGIRDGLSRWAEQARNVAGAVSDLIGQTLDGLTNMITQFVLTGKMGFADFIRSAIAGVEQLIIKMLVLKAVEAAMNFLLPGSGSVLAAVHHGGGMAGRGFGRSVDPSVFVGAPRLHGGGMAGDAYRRMLGLKKGEVPAILLEDERVLNPQETKAYNAAMGSKRAQAMGGGVFYGGSTQMTFAPSVQITMPGGARASGDGLPPEQMEKANKALEGEMNIFMQRWVERESRPGGLLHQTGRR